jgi:archaellum component FlaC
VENELENLKEQIRKVEQELERVRKENTILIETETNINGQLDGQKSRVAQLERELKESQEKVKDLEGTKINL